MVVNELLLLVVDNVGAHGIEETRVVGDNHRGNVSLSVEVWFEE